MNSYKLGSFSLLQSLRDSFLVRGSRSLEVPTFGLDPLDKVGASKLVPPSDEGGAEGGRREKAEGLYGLSEIRTSLEAFLSFSRSATAPSSEGAAHRKPLPWVLILWIR